MNRQYELIERLKPQQNPTPHSLAAMERPRVKAEQAEPTKTVSLWVLAGQLTAFDQWRYSAHMSQANAMRAVLKDFPHAPPSFKPVKGGAGTTAAAKIPPAWYQENGYVRTNIHMYEAEHRKFSYLWRTHKISAPRLMQELLQMQLFPSSKTGTLL